jgi:hypothetical protein
MSETLATDAVGAEVGAGASGYLEQPLANIVAASKAAQAKAPVILFM